MIASVRAAVAVAAAILIVTMTSAAVAQDRTAEGERLFRARCASCHAVQAGRNTTGPHLAGIVGRKAGTVAEARYSRALSASDIVWNDQTMDTYLSNPRQAVPGTTMMVGVPDAAQRSAMIAYLGTLSGGAR